MRQFLSLAKKIYRVFRSRVCRCYFGLQYPGLTFGSGVLLNERLCFKVTDGATCHIGNSCCIERNSSILARRGSLKIGAYTHIGEGVIICAIESVKVGGSCLIASGVVIRDQDHGTKLGGGPFRLQSQESAPISIGNNVWIGTKATILKGVKIGDNSVVGANAVVTKDVESGVVVAGVPARVIKRLACTTEVDKEA